MQPLNRRTWSPRGITPVQRAWDRHDRLSVIAAVTLSPQRQQIRTPFAMRSRNIVTTDVVNFVKRLRRQLRRPLIVILDRWSVHRAAVKRLQAEGVSGLEFAWLPAYAPELNPVESLWGWSKYSDLANHVPDDTPRLPAVVRRSLRKPRRRPQL
ncbi:MAG: transposase [Planctomycetaceae bacterium]|nr:transposase [Planctomycetaceae bacterium]